MATVFKEIVVRGEDRECAQRFILQLLVAMVAEDIGLLPNDLVLELLTECAENGVSSYDLIGGLFRQMACENKARGGRFEKVDYFNGGLFEVVDPIELKRAEAYRLRESAVERVLARAIALPAARFLRMKRSVSLLVSDRGSAGRGAIIDGTYQSPILVQWNRATGHGVESLTVLSEGDASDGRARTQ